MLRNFLLVTFRNMKRNVGLTILNLLGLSISIGCASVVFLYINMVLNYDVFHENRDRIFLIESWIERNGENLLYGLSPAPLGPSIERDFACIEQTVRVERDYLPVQVEGNHFTEHVFFVDAGYFSVFTFPLISGDNDILNDASTAVISSSYQEKYFGEESALGRIVTVTLQDTISQSYIIRGITENIPSNASFGSDIILPYASLENLGIKSPESWGQWTSATFLLLHEGDDINIFTAEMDSYLEVQNESNENWPIQSFVFDPLRNVTSVDRKLNSSILEDTGTIEIATFGAIGILLLLLACTNYTNNTIVLMSKRFREIGIRKVIGGNRKLIIVQFLGENIITCLLALVLGILLSSTLLVPAWEHTLSMNLEFDFLGNTNLWIYLAVLLVLTGFGTGAYPALYVSRYNPVEIFRQRTRVGGQGVLIQILMTTQFFFTFIMVIFAVSLFYNGHYQEQADWGYDYRNSITIPLDDTVDYDVFHNTVETIPGIETIAGSTHHIGNRLYNNFIHLDGEDYQLSALDVGPEYFDAVGIRTVLGKTFDASVFSDVDQTVVVNQAFLRTTGFEDPLNQPVMINNSMYSIIGVVEDIYDHGFDTELWPRIFHLDTESSNYRWMIVRTNAEALDEVADQIEDRWVQLYPDIPYPGYLQEQTVTDYFDNYYMGIRFLSFPVVMALLLSAMGIFGLVSSNIANRKREISIRKVLGGIHCCDSSSIGETIDPGGYHRLGTGGIPQPVPRGNIYRGAIPGLLCACDSCPDVVTVNTVDRHSVAVVILDLQSCHCKSGGNLAGMIYGNRR